MTQFLRVLRFSYSSIMHSKGMIVSTIILCVIIAGGMCVPSIIQFFDKDKEPEPGISTTSQPGEQPGEELAEEPGERLPMDTLVYVSDPSAAMFAGIDELRTTFPDYDWVMTDKSADDLRAMVENEELHAAVLVNSAMNAEYYYRGNINVFGGAGLSGNLQAYITDRYQQHVMDVYDINAEHVAELFNTPSLTPVMTSLQIAGQIQSMLFILLLYMSILGSGTMVATSVAQEKSSRAMEVLITTTKPEKLMFGKVIGVGLAGLSQMVFFIATAVAFYFINQNAIGSFGELAQFFAIPPLTFVYALVFFFGGYFFYAALFAAIGSLVSRVEDLSSANTPMTLLSVAGFLVAIYGQMYGFAGTTFYKVLSYIPLTSPYVMLARVCSEPNLALWAILSSIAVLYACTIGTAILSAKIYRIGVLIYGKRPSLKEVFAALKQA